MNRRGYLIAALGLALVASLAVFVAQRTSPSTIAGISNIDSIDDLPIIAKGPAPSLAIGRGFLNTKPLKDADLDGKVVVYDFWTYSCINCVRTLPYLESWHERYAKDGLVIVGVHSPEFDFEKNHSNVAAAAKRLGVTYPVVYDDDLDIWREFNNMYWPAKYVTDRQGNVRFTHFGEGEYSQTEQIIRVLLGVDKSSPKANDPKKPESKLTAALTRETYLGAERGHTESPQEMKLGQQRFTLPKPLTRNNFGLEGDWLVADQYLESTDAHENLDLRYQAGEVNLVMDRTRKNPTYVVIELDGKPVPKSAWGKSIEELDGQTIVRIDAADLYHLIENGPKGDHTLRVHPGGSGVQVYAFTFGS